MTFCLFRELSENLWDNFLNGMVSDCTRFNCFIAYATCISREFSHHSIMFVSKQWNIVSYFAIYQIHTLKSNEICIQVHNKFDFFWQ